MNKGNPVFTLKNFRSFGEEGANFELAPITVITGCNSAGKSSMVKALMLLSEKGTLKLDNIELTNNLKLSSKRLCLGGYNSVSHEDGKIILAYRIWSVYLQEELIVTRRYHARPFDALNDGSLESLTVEKTDGTIIYNIIPDNIDGSTTNDNLDAIKDYFIIFYATCCYMEFMDLLRSKEERLNKWIATEDFDQKKEEELNKEFNQRKEEELNNIKRKLDAAGITEQEAVQFWNESFHKVFLLLLNHTLDYIFHPISIVSISDLQKNHQENENEWKDMMKEFLNQIVIDVCSPFFTQRVLYINSSSAHISRQYSTEDDSKIGNALRDFNHRTILFHEELNRPSTDLVCLYEPGAFMNKWIKTFNIGDSIEVKGTDEGLGLMVYLKKDNSKRILADEGYGITQLISLLLQIDNSITLIDEQDYPLVSSNISSLSYPVKVICVEEPEVHLHPKYQSLLADMFVEAYQKYHIHFIIETHSEYLIRKLQVMVADKENPLSSKDVSLNYVEKDENGISTNRKIEIQEDGRLDGSFGEGFFDEAGELARQLFNLSF